MALINLLFGIAGNATSILVFASPLPTFWRIFKKKSTENFRALPYVCTLLSTMLWAYYGIIKPGGILILTINGAGCAFEAFYIVVYLTYAPKDRKIGTARFLLLLNFILFGLVLALTVALAHGNTRVVVVGAITSAISVSMYAAPLGIMRTVIRTRSVEFMPFFLSLFLVLNGAIWSVYALLIKDIFVEIPNAIGFVLGATQLAIYCVYRKGRSKKDSEGLAGSKLEVSNEESEMEMGSSWSTSPANGSTSMSKISMAPSANVADVLNSQLYAFEEQKHTNGHDEIKIKT